MTLFKVTRHDRSKKVVIKATTLEELIEKAKTKLKVADGVYKVALDEDGTEVDDDEILLNLAKLSINATNLILLPEDSSWPPLIQNTAAASSSVEKSNSAISIAKDKENKNSRSSAEELGGNIWKKFPKRLTECCKNGQRALEADRRTMVASIADYMTPIYDPNIADYIPQKYPNTFSDVINNKFVGSGMESLRQQIYNAVNYRKINKETKRRAEMRLSEEMENGDSALAPSKPRKQDEYGCTDYEPLLPSNESATSQREKKLQLIQFFESNEKDDKKISQLMDDTYPTQRVDINHKTMDFVKIFELWPYLHKPKYLIEYASRLLGKSVQAVLDESLTTHAKPLRKYVVFTEKSKMIKNPQRQSASDNERKTSDNAILQMISATKASSTAAQSKVALMAVVFPLITNQLKENSEYLFRVTTEDTEGTEILPFAEQDSPILIVRGQSLFDEKAKCDVLLGQKVIVSARGVLDGFFITFLAYYIFGYVYLPEVQKSLEFIQRVLLQMNPKTGYKRKDNKKRKAVSYDPAVMKLANILEVFKDK